VSSADPWETPSNPAFQYRQRRSAHIQRCGGPERIYDEAAADPAWKPRRVGFTAPLPDEDDADPLRWDGDDS
jgi:hypothetical protein